MTMNQRSKTATLYRMVMPDLLWLVQSRLSHR